MVRDLQVRGGAAARWLILPGLAVLLVLFVLPLVVIVKAALFDGAATSGLLSRLISSPLYVGVLLQTIKTSIIVACLCLLVGYPAAYFVSRQPPQRRAILIFLILVPMWMSILVRTYAWMIVLGREGLINGLLLSIGAISVPLKLSFSTGGVYLVMVQVLLPFMVMTCYASMIEIDETYMRAARVLGAGAMTAFSRVFLPLSLEGAVTGFMLVFMLSVGFFIVPALIGAPGDAMFANLIADQVEKANWDFAAVMAAILLILAIAIMAAIRLVARRLVFHMGAGLSS